MWQLYTVAGQGIAIESTKAKLEGALGGNGIVVDQVRYMDFESAEIEKGHKRYGLFLKRKSFAHERREADQAGDSSTHHSLEALGPA
jgi:hypothetical protein